MQQTADRPWLRRPDWAAGQIEFQPPSIAALILSWFMAAWFWVAIPMIVRVVWRNRSTMEHDARIAAPILIAILLAGAWFFLRQAIRTTRRRRFGVSVLELREVPGTIGGHLRGTIRISSNPDDRRVVDATLACFRRRPKFLGPNYTAEDQNVTIYQPPVFEATGQFPLNGISIQIPPNVSATDTSQKDTVIGWRLLVQGPGDYYARFWVPVFKA